MQKFDYNIISIVSLVGCFFSTIFQIDKHNISTFDELKTIFIAKRSFHVSSFFSLWISLYTMFEAFITYFFIFLIPKKKKVIFFLLINYYYKIKLL